MPPKRKEDAESAPPSTAASAPAVKRQRVSRACDQCRGAREKCDGVHPSCYSCITLERECTYNDAPKKRGVQTGLIRTLESAIYWLFERYPGSEAALNDLLASEAGREALSIGKRRDSGNRLHQRWRKCRTHKDIARLLSGAKDGANLRNSDEDESGTEPEAMNQPGEPSGTVIPRRSYRLPRDAARLLDIYFAYTHAWLPIVDRNRLMTAASSSEARDAELWSALAVAAAQDPENHSNAADIHATAYSLLPLLGEDANDGQPVSPFLELQQVNAFLLLSLVKLGQDNASSASLLVGLAVRILLNIGYNDQGYPPADLLPQKDRTLMAAFILDSHISMRLGQVPHLTASAMEEVSPLAEQGPDEWDPWQPVPGFSSDAHPHDDDDTASPAAQSLSTFNQLFRLARVLNHNAASRQPPQPGELAAALDPRFSWCNSVLESAAPLLPAALLLQASFLGSTFALSPSGRVSLLWNLMESVETAWLHLGPGAAPLLVTYMGIANRRAKGFGGEDKERWDALLAKLKATWEMPQSRQQAGTVGPHLQQPPADLAELSQPPPLPVQPGPYDYQQQQQQQQLRHVGPGTATSPSTSRSMPFTPGNGGHMAGMHGSMMSPMMHMHPMLSFQGGELLLDHENILDELASFDCADNMEVDPQFMANLGFAPGSDFPDMRGDFGGM
ncbi:quinic acid utilization activator [Plectosphaerella plurivora]|uniref:Quinic acid utilization activator n=1 Tax=Plectosphaerella plurivora TaxID=936078 RepID=A0A9P8V3C8_9PEZI|nr:quinic acid utilization activator [Plectosphaerella plurivora]